MNPVNWFRLITDLEKAGFTDLEMAQSVGLKSPGSISKYKSNEAEPGHFMGEKIRALHFEHCLAKVSEKKPEKGYKTLNAQANPRLHTGSS